MGKLSVYEFGRQLLETKDLDPVYIALHEAQLDRSTLQQWLLTYFCFYHCGTASWVVDEGLYWKAMATAAGSKEWPRSSERRHFRGGQAARSVEWLRARGVAGLFDPLAQFTTAAEIMEYVQTWKGFGPWIAFKVADIIERLGMYRVQFSLDEAMYESPRKAAELLWSMEGEPHAGAGASAGEWAVDRLLSKLGKTLAPPRYERPINVQECETILCKWASYLNGHYHVGKDIVEVKHGLERFKGCTTSQRLLAAGERGGLWQTWQIQ